MIRHHVFFGDFGGDWAYAAGRVEVDGIAPWSRVYWLPLVKFELKVPQNVKVLQYLCLLQP